jgi:pimeloyl-ACP methyl ester carboxylesterase
LSVGVDKVPQGATPDWTFGGSWPHAPRFFGHEGVRLHYVDEGTGEPVAMLHGNPTWGYVYRNFVAPLSANRRCVVPDHVGVRQVGQTARPRHRSVDRLLSARQSPPDRERGALLQEDEPDRIVALIEDFLRRNL